MSTTNTSVCPMCGDMVKTDWWKCPRCGGPLQGTQTSPNPMYGVSLVMNRKAAIHVAENSPLPNKINKCPMCGDIVKAGWGECPRCGEALETVMAFPGVWYENPVTTNRKVVQLRPDQPPTEKTRISTCSLCGDMVRADWDQCPRCGEHL